MLLFTPKSVYFINNRSLQVCADKNYFGRITLFYAIRCGRCLASATVGVKLLLTSVTHRHFLLT